MDRALWKRFADQFHAEDADSDGGWRGEYWGKMMRGACLTYAYTRTEELYHILEETIRDMLSAQETDGRISTYGTDHERTGWDLWCRKYVLLGMEYFLEICEDEELGRQVLQCLCGQADALLMHVGEGKQKITEASGMYRGLNSSSILEPVVRLYRLTGKERYLKLAEHIVDCGGTSVCNIFRLAYENGLYPYQYPVTKAYELMSCFEGLLEYYEATGISWCREAVVRFAEKLLESDVTVTGSCGCTHEFLDHSFHTQADDPETELMQETCVTVTWMRFLSRMIMLTGETKYADAFEKAMYNAYFGAINTEGKTCGAVQEKYPEAEAEALPFDSYSPLTASHRGRGTGGLLIMADGHYYGCCACIGALGNGLIPQMAILKQEKGLMLNLYIPGEVRVSTPAGKPLKLLIETAYPAEGRVRLTVFLSEPEKFVLMLRNPEWSSSTAAQVNNADIPVSGNVISIERCWNQGDTVELNLDMRTRAVSPVSYGTDVLMNREIWELDYIVPVFRRQSEQARHRRAFTRGPVTLAADTRLGWEAEKPVPVVIGEDGTVQTRTAEVSWPHMVAISLPLEGGKWMTVTDYASAGKRWEEDCIAAWITVASGEE